MDLLILKLEQQLKWSGYANCKQFCVRYESQKQQTGGMINPFRPFVQLKFSQALKRRRRGIF